MLKSIGKIQLQNNGGFVARIQFQYFDERSNLWLHADGTGDITLGFSGKADPGDYGVPEGSMIKLYTSVVWGKDNEAKEMFVYERNNDLTACYSIAGTTLNNHLNFLGTMESPMMRAGLEMEPEESDSDMLSPEELMELEQNFAAAPLAQSGCYGPLSWNVNVDVNSKEVLKSGIDVKISLFGITVLDAKLNANNPRAAADLRVKGVGVTTEIGVDFDQRIVYLKGRLNFARYTKEFNMTVLSF